MANGNATVTRWVVGTAVVVVLGVAGAAWQIAASINAVEARTHSAYEELLRGLATLEADLSSLDHRVIEHVNLPYHSRVLLLIDSEITKQIRPIERTLERIEEKVDKLAEGTPN